MDDQQIIIIRGDTVEIKAQGETVTGTVISASYSFLGKDWNIEFTDSTGTYRYWKQKQDGGTVRLLKKAG